MVKLKEDKRAMPWPRRISRTELERFWLKLREDVLNCGEIMPNTSMFYRNFSDLTYDSFEEALENFGGFRDACCRGEEYEVSEKYTWLGKRKKKTLEKARP